MASELETRTTDQPAETPTTPAGTADAWDTDPDEQNYANGNNPEIAWRNQGNPDSPNGWGHTTDTSTQHGDTADQAGQPADTAGSGEQADSWGEDPDLQNYPHWDQTTPDLGIPETAADGQVDASADQPESGYNTLDASTSQSPDHGAGVQEQPENTAATSPEQQRTGNPEADNADSRQQIADANQKINDLETKYTEASQKVTDLEARNAELEARYAESSQKVANLEARCAELEGRYAESSQRITELEAKNDEQATQLGEQGTRLDRIEQLLAGPEKTQDSGVLDHGDTSPASASEQQAQDAARADKQSSAERRDMADAKGYSWKRATSSEGLGLIATFGGAAQTLGEFAAHATPEGAAGLVVTAFGVAHVIKARREKNAERKGKGQA
jgi:uncharacterized coiled-coil protein SlyX